MLSNLKIGTRLFLLLTLLVALTVTVGAVGMYHLHAADTAMDGVYLNQVLPLQQMKSIGDAYDYGVINSARKTQLGLLSWDSAFALSNSADDTVERQWGDYMRTEMSADEAEVNKKGEPQLKVARAATDALRDILKAHDTTRLNAWLGKDRFDAFDPISQTVDEIAMMQSKNAKAAYDAAQASYIRTRTTVIIITAASALIAFLLGYVIIRDITSALEDAMETAERIASGDLATNRTESTRKDEIGSLHRAMSRMVANLAGLIGDVQRSGIQLNTSATEISATSRQQQTTATEVASTTLEVGATARQISATSKELVRTMHDITESADAMASLAGSGQQGLSRMGASMEQITEATAAINTRFAVLNDRAANINTVVTTIAKVADRTNLLSLNAAIEAEKAGEYGRGFAVVATEIRRLADQTADATTDIEQMVREIQSAISAGVMGTDKFSEEVRRAVEAVGDVSGQLTDIITQVQAVTPRFDAVVDGMQSQSDGAQQISEALGQLGEASQQTVESLVQSTEALEQLNEAARGLQNGVSRFKVAV